MPASALRGFPQPGSSSPGIRFALILLALDAWRRHRLTFGHMIPHGQSPSDRSNSVRRPNPSMCDLNNDSVLTDLELLV